MCKKGISIITTLAMVAALVVPTGSFAASAADTLKGRTAVVGAEENPVISSGSNLSFWDDYVTKHDGGTISNLRGLYTWGQGSANNTISIEAAGEDGSNANACGNAGSSVKSVFGKPEVAVTTAESLSAGAATSRYYSMLAYNSDFTVPAAALKTASIAVWVKTETQLEMCMSLYYSWGNNSCISQRITVPAGENIVEIPLGAFVIAQDAFNADGAALRVTQLRIYYTRADRLGTGTTAYFDNIGLYQHITNGNAAATQRSKTITQINMENCTPDNYKTLVGQWKNESATASFVLAEETDGVNANAYGGNGKSIGYINSNLTTAYDRARMDCSKVSLKDANGIAWGEDATLCIWMKTSRSVTVYLSVDDSYQWTDTQKRWKSSEYTLAAGENILRIPVSDFATFCGTGESPATTWDFLGSLNFYIKSATSSTGSYSLYIDQIGFEPATIGDINDDDEINIVDLIRLKKVLAGEISLKVIKAADVNASNAVDANDLTRMRSYLTGVAELASAPFQAVATTAIVVNENPVWGYDS